MKNRILLLTAAMLLLACGKENEEKKVKVPEANYIGTVTVTFQGTDYDSENISVNFTPNKDGKTASITIYQIRFVPQMPVTINATIPNVKMKRTEDAILLSCDGVVPLALQGEIPDYTVHNLSGEVKGDDLSFSLLFGDHPTSYSGTKVQTE